MKERARRAESIRKNYYARKRIEINSFTYGMLIPGIKKGTMYKRIGIEYIKDTSQGKLCMVYYEKLK